MSSRVMVIGIDGGTWDIINPMIERGELPNLQRLRENGIWSNLMTTIPSQTVPAWPSCVTGVNPGKLGVFHFSKDSHSNYDQGRLITVNDLRIKTLWEILSDHDKKIIGVTVPLTYPPPAVNGVMISPVNPRAVKELKEMVVKTYPAELLEEFQDVLELNVERLTMEKSTIDHMKGMVRSIDRNDLLDRMKSFNLMVIDKLKDFALYLMNSRDWDFLMFVFTSIDGIQHHFWSFMDLHHPAYDKKLAEQYGDVIPLCYKHVDSAIGKIVKNAGDDVTVIILSDHGFGPIHKFLFLNNWLKSKGFLHLKKNGITEYQLSKYSFEKILNRLSLTSINRVLPACLSKISVPIPRKRMKPLVDSIDWQQTKAYATSYAINVNLKGREPFGIVDRKEYPNIVGFLKEELYNLVDPETGEKIIEEVYQKEEIYQGPHVEKAPDILFAFKTPHYFCRKDIFETKVFRPVRSKDVLSAHHLNSMTGIYKGIFVIYGEIVKNGKTNISPNIIDIAPTVLYILGLPVPEAMDGRVLTECISDEYLRANPIRYSDTDITRQPDVQSDLILTEDEEEMIKERLKDLGYLG